MINLIKLAAAFLIILSLVFPASVAKYDQAKELLVVLGDSIPYGYNLGENNDQPAELAYPYLVGDKKNLHVDNLGIPGWQTGQLLSALQTEPSFREAVEQADYIAVTIGNNDLLEILRKTGTQSSGKQDLFQELLAQNLANSDVFTNIYAILAEIQQHTDAPVVLYNIYNPFPLDDPLHSIADAILPAINEQFAQIAVSPEVYLADADAAFGDDQETLVLRGDIHPTAAGQEVLAEIGEKAIDSIKTVK